MKHTLTFFLLIATLFAVGCRGPQNNETPVEPKKIEDGYYKGRGFVTKINNDLGSVELDHEEIPNLMPAMKMEFTVTDKRMLKDIAVGDTAIFVVEYMQGAEKIASIEKAR